MKLLRIALLALFLHTSMTKTNPVMATSNSASRQSLLTSFTAGTVIGTAYLKINYDYRDYKNARISGSAFIKNTALVTAATLTAVTTLLVLSDGCTCTLND